MTIQGVSKSISENKGGIEFSNKSWSFVLKQAKKENKLIFIDCYTSWCGPCKRLAREIFPQKSVGDYFNKNFVNLKINMEKGIGLKLKKKFKVKVFPTLLFVDHNQNVIHSGTGFLKAENLIALAKEATSDNNLYNLNKKYDSGNRDINFINGYLKKLQSVRDNERLNKVVKNHFKNMKSEDYIKKQNWDILKLYNKDIYSDSFIYLCNHKDKFIKLYGEKDVNNKIRYTYSGAAYGFVKDVNGKKTIDNDGFKKYISTLKTRNVKDADKYILYGRLNNSFATGNLVLYTNLINGGLKSGIIDTNKMSMYNYVLKCKKSDNKFVLKSCLEWINLALKDGKKDMWTPHFQKMKKEISEKIK